METLVTLLLVAKAAHWYLGIARDAGVKSARIACGVCGDGINYDREIVAKRYQVLS